MRSIARSVYLDSGFGVPQELPHAGSPLENPFVYDDAAREIKQMAEQGLVRILSESRTTTGDETLIDRLTFLRLR